MPRGGNGAVWQRTTNGAELYDSSKEKCSPVYLENMSKRGSSGIWGDDRGMNGGIPKWDPCKRRAHGSLLHVLGGILLSLLDVDNGAQPSTV